MAPPCHACSVDASQVVDSGAMDHGIKVSTVNISSSDPQALARFYAALLGLEIKVDEPDWVVISGPDSVPIAFELDQHYQPPVWPSEPGKPPTQMHLEVQVDDLQGALAHALEVRRAARGLPAAGRRAGLLRPGRTPVLPVARRER